jgi:hypothetical protein
MAACIDTDQLEIAGEWEYLQTYAPWVMPVAGRVGTDRWEVHLETTPGPGAHGGVNFKGYFLPSTPQEGTFYGETFYNARGVQLVQMHMELESHCYYQLLSGKHTIDRAEVLIDGAYVDVGGFAPDPSTGRVASGYFGLFQLRKLVKPR